MKRIFAFLFLCIIDKLHAEIIFMKIKEWCWMMVLSQIVRVVGTKYFLALMLISSYYLIFIDRRTFKEQGFKKESRFSYILGLIYGAVGLITFILTNSVWIR